MSQLKIKYSILPNKNLLSMGILFFLGLFTFLACNKKEEEDSKEVLLKIGEKELTVDEVVNMIPIGLYPVDSINLFKSIVDGWIKDELLCSFAEERLLDTEKIDRMVKDYRAKLIVDEYLTKMKETHKPEVDEKAIKEYYNQHYKDILTETPLIKGVFLKLHSESKGKDEIRKLLSENKDDNIDILEENWLDDAITYDYFKDKWVDWETVAGLIPHRFSNPDSFLNENKYFEQDYGDCTYYLLISDYLPTGSIQPYEFASVWISNLLSRIELTQYERNLVESLIKKAIQEKKLEVISYDPIKRNMIEKI